MVFKLKTILAVIALTATSAATAATVPNVTVSTAVLGSGANGSSLVFSAWNDTAGTGYSVDLGYTLNQIIGADTIVSGSAGTANNTMADATLTSSALTSGQVISIALPDWNLSSGSWNMAAVDTTGRNRLLVTNSSAWTGATNGDIKLAGAGLNNYLNQGAALSTSAGTLSATATSDAWYPNSASWGDSLGGTGITGTAFDLTGTANLFVAYQKSITSSNGGLGGGYAALTTLTGGQTITAYLSNVSGVEYLNIAAVPEADTSGMMLAGLGLMGFIARRRNSKKA